MAVYKRGKHWHMDVTIAGERYRERLATTDKREAISLEKQRITEIMSGKAASKSGRALARVAFPEAAEKFLSDRAAHVSERTIQFEGERLKPLRKFFGDRPLSRIKADDVSTYQRERLKVVHPRTVNMEVGVLSRMLRRAKVWNAIAEDVRSLPEPVHQIGRVLTQSQKRKLFQTAASRPDWMVAHCAAILSMSTTCRGVELKNLRWSDVDLPGRVLTESVEDARRIEVDSVECSGTLCVSAVVSTRRCTRRERTRPLRYSQRASTNA